MSRTFRLNALFLCCSGFVFSESLRFDPSSVRQGELLQVFGNSSTREARLNGKTVPLYSSGPSASLGLMPIPVATPPGTYTLEWIDDHDKVTHSEHVLVRNAHYLIQNVQLSQALTELHSTSDERDEVSKFFDISTTVRYWEFPIHSPIPGCLTSPFGVQRAHNGKLTGDIHSGLDQRGAMGTAIHAVTGGEVRLSGQFALHGGTVGIDHGQGLKSMYLHMSRIAAKVGDRVEAGDVIGYVGSTGRSTGPHLHWSLYANGEPVNPLQWIDLKPCPKKAATPSRRTSAKH